ncbi:glycosyl hydrolase family 28-related protein [Pontivivens insulae]|uniref:Rhamnogalacturonase A/B/Epimerase-like pectate lyase domain-containing protein n=1 Tax=Pontivivens insulae TaxID=1639689 RepID=A0A2R8AF91_9RHOB|nr:glycosyl hydrolase family 28-related protein [Pontivivens insulae]RED11974.1 pectate lyase-like protein [Pontivivens insulae]SPF30730.1 hypothetical protein POI8812_03072 [Pontivivens insulae]
MNKVITDGITLMPPAFADGLSAWSRVDGRPGDASYLGAADAFIVTADADFGDCLEITKTETIQRLRSFTETPVTPGCYLKISARVKLVGGNRPNVRIAAYAGGAGGGAVANVLTTGPETFLANYGVPYEITAIVGAGNRSGVDMGWGPTAQFGHFGLDITGDNGAVVRIESIRIEDATEAFHRTLMDWVDVRDYGAVGDGVTDDSVAFLEADAAANGRDVLVSEGTYFIGQSITMDAHMRFTGTISNASPGRIAFTENYCFDTYMDAFGDEQIALERAIQALYGFTDHDSLDLNGRRILLTRPIDVQAIVADRDRLNSRRVIRNGRIETSSSGTWDTTTTTSTASYSTSNNLKLTSVANIATIEVGSRITGAGVGREVYVREVDTAAGELTLSQPLFAVAASQSYTFTRDRYMLDYSGWEFLGRQVFHQVEFHGGARNSAIMLPRDGIAWHIKDCWFLQQADRCITSIGEGCNGMTIEGNEFLSSQMPDNVVDRTVIALNTNKNDIKLRNNRAVQFKHWAVLSGGGHLIVGNHFWQGDDVAGNAPRTAGIVFCNASVKSTLTGNYIDNAFVELTNEHTANRTSNRPYGNLTITGNIFTASGVGNDFAYLVVRPTATARRLDGYIVTDNAFKTIGGGQMFRVEKVDTTWGSLDSSQFRNVVFQNNAFEEVTIRTQSPVVVSFNEFFNKTSWDVQTGGRLPFGGRAMAASAPAPLSDVNGYDGRLPTVSLQHGVDGSQVGLNWYTSVRGTVQMTIWGDIPT